MSDFAGMEDLLQDFLIGAGDLLSSMDNKLADLERAPHDRGLLNEIFRSFHSIKGGAGFLNATELVNLCHLTENLLDKLRNAELDLQPEIMATLLAATATVRQMFGSLEQGVQLRPADAGLIERLKRAIAGELNEGTVREHDGAAEPTAESTGEPDWELLHRVASGLPINGDAEHGSSALPKRAVAAGQAPEDVIRAAVGRRATDWPGAAAAPSGRREGECQRDTSIRVDTARLDHVLDVSGEIGLTSNRLTALRSDILSGRSDRETLHALDLAVSRLDLLVSDLHGALMKTRMQPIGRLFQKYPRIARDLARNLGKDVELVVAGEETEVEPTMMDGLGDLIIHLIRNAVDHGVENPLERVTRGKPPKSVLRLGARQEGDRILITIEDDGRGMNAERLRAKALEKGLITAEQARSLDERESYDLVFLPGFSMAAQVSDVSGRGVGMDVVRTNIQRLNGSVEIRSQANNGTTFVISLPLTLAMLPVLFVRLGEQAFAVPLSMVREILPIDSNEIQEVGGRATMVIRGELLPVLPLAGLLGWPLERTPGFGVLMHAAEFSFVLAVDALAGREDALIKSLADFRPKGVAGVTTLANGQAVLALDMKALLGAVGELRGVAREALIRDEAPAAPVQGLVTTH